MFSDQRLTLTNLMHNSIKIALLEECSPVNSLHLHEKLFPAATGSAIYKNYAWKFCKINRKIPAPGSLFK